jgi:hypothetical protein
MELLVPIAVLAVFVLAWIGLAIASVQKGHPIFVLGALIVPFPAFFIGVQVTRRLLASADPDDDLGRFLGAAVTVIAVSILSSYVVLAVGAILPRAESVDSGGAPLSIERLIGGQTSMDDSVDSSEDWDQESDV